MTTKSHYYFFLNPSPWPYIASICSFSFMTSLLMFFKYGNLTSMLISILLLTLGCFFWWNSYSGEFSLEGKSSILLESGIKFGMILFISSEIFFFFSFFWSYFHYLLSPVLEVGLAWPPTEVEVFDFSNVPLINTLVLMGSGLTVTLSHYYFFNNKFKKSSCWLWVTFSMGVLFSILQGLEYKNSFFSISDGNFGTSFFILTGFHGLHVLIGSIFLMTVFYRMFKVCCSNKNFLSFELASWYWHFVDVVWIFLYFFLYYINY